jgi:hypothetical protein
MEETKYSKSVSIGGTIISAEIHKVVKTKNEHECTLLYLDTCNEFIHKYEIGYPSFRTHSFYKGTCTMRLGDSKFTPNLLN